MYSYKDKFYEGIFKIDAGILGIELESIRKQNNGRLKPKHVVDVAQDPLHPLHPLFEWDDELAAKKYRQSQASLLIRSIVVVYESEGETYSVRAFHSVKDAKGKSYHDIESVLTDKDMRRQVFLTLRKDIQELKSKYAGIEFASRHTRELFAAMNTILELNI